MQKRLGFWLALITLIGVLAACSSFSGSLDVPEANQVHTITSSTLPLPLKWQANTDDPIRFRPYALSDLVVVKTAAVGCARCANSKAKLVAFDAQSGKKLWESAYTGFVEDRAPISFDKALVLPVNADRSVRAIDKDSGRLLWETELLDTADYIDGLVQDGQRIYVASGTGTVRVYALEPQSGKTLWQVSDIFPAGGLVTLAYYQERLFVLFVNQIFELDPLTGKLIKQQHSRLFSFGIPTFRNEIAFVTQREGGIEAIDFMTASVQWKFEPPCIEDAAQNEGPARLGKFFRFPPSLIEGLALVNGGCKKVFALAANTGQVKWEYASGGASSLSPVVAVDDVGYAIFTDGSLRALDLATGNEIGRAETSPIPLDSFMDEQGLSTVNGTLFATFGDRTIFAFSK